MCEAGVISRARNDVYVRPLLRACSHMCSGARCPLGCTCRRCSLHLFSAWVLWRGRASRSKVIESEEDDEARGGGCERVVRQAGRPRNRRTVSSRSRTRGSEQQDSVHGQALDRRHAGPALVTAPRPSNDISPRPRPNYLSADPTGILPRAPRNTRPYEGFFVVVPIFHKPVWRPGSCGTFLQRQSHRPRPQPLSSSQVATPTTHKRGAHTGQQNAHKRVPSNGNDSLQSPSRPPAPPPPCAAIARGPDAARSQ